MIDDTLLDAEEKMEKAVAVAKEEFGVIRTGRAHPAMFNKITAEYYGTQTPLNQLASFHMPEPRMVVIQPFDKSSLAAIERAIRNSDLGVNPTNDGIVIRDRVPRADRGAPHGVHQGRPAQGRGRPGLDPQHPPARQGRAGQAGQDRRRGEDDVRRAERELDELTHTYDRQVDELLKHKEAELLEV